MNRQVPHDLEAERSVIGACLLSQVARDISLPLLTPTDFYKQDHQAVFHAIGVLCAAGEDVDVVTVAAQLGADDNIRADLMQMIAVPPSVSSSSYARTVLAHSKSRALIALSGDIAAAGYDRRPAAEAADYFARVLADDELLRRHESGVLRGFYDDIATLDPGQERDLAQPWVHRGVVRRGQRLMIVARAGIGKSVVLRQLAFCAANGVHCWTGQPTEHKRNALVVELEAAAWDITDSMRSLMFRLQAILHTPSVFDLHRPALLHRQGGLDLRSPDGYAALESAIQRAQPDLVVIGPVKYMSIAKPGENYEIAALRLMALLNDLIARYDFALALEAHFSRGDHGAPGGSERWVDWPDLGFGIHPPDDDITKPMRAGGAGTRMDVKAFRIPRDSTMWLPQHLHRGVDGRLPWSVEDIDDPYRYGATIFASRYGGMPDGVYQPYDQQEF